MKIFPTGFLTDDPITQKCLLTLAAQHNIGEVHGYNKRSGS